LSTPKTSSLASITGRDEFIIGEALATALIALEQLPEVRQPTRNMADMKLLLNTLLPHAEVSLQPQDGGSCPARGRLERATFEQGEH